MSVLFRKIVVPNLQLRYLRSIKELLWFKRHDNLYRLGIKNDVIIGIKEFSPIYINKTNKDEVYKGDIILTVETDKTILDLYSPFDAKVIGFNSNFVNNLSCDTNFEDIFSWVIALKKIDFNN